ALGLVPEQLDRAQHDPGRLQAPKQDYVREQLRAVRRGHLGWSCRLCRSPIQRGAFSELRGLLTPRTRRVAASNLARLRSTTMTGSTCSRSLLVESRPHHSACVRLTW